MRREKDSATTPQASTPLVVTKFADQSAQEMEAFAVLCWGDLCAALVDDPVTEKSKADLPWLKLAKFDGSRTKNNCLRHDAGLEVLYGGECDYDQGDMSFDAAVAALTSAGVESLVITSPSYKPEHPKLRVLFPLETPVTRADLGTVGLKFTRRHYVKQLSKLLPGTIDNASFTLSQAFVFGRVEGNEYKATRIAGKRIDTISPAPKHEPPKEEKKQRDEGDQLDPLKAFDAIRDGDNFHDGTMRLAASMARRGTPEGTILAMLQSAMNGAKNGNAARWQARYDDLPRLVRSGVDLFAPKAKAKADPAAMFAGVVPSDLWSKWIAPPLPQGLLPPVIDSLAWHRCELAGFDPGFSGMSMVTTCAAAIPTSVQIQVKDNEPSYCEPPILWTMLVGPPSVKKSPVFRTAMAPVYAEQAAANEEHVAALASYHARKTEASKAKKEREQAEKRAAAATAAKRERERESKQANEALRKQRLAGFKAACKAAREGHHEACKAAKAAGLPAPKLVLPDPPPTMETPLAEIAAGAAAVAAMASAAGEPDIGEPPVRRRVVVDDATVEALSEVLKHEVNATGQVIAGSEEGISFVVPSGYSGAQGAREIAARLELSGSGGKVVDRISRPEVFAPEWSLSFLGTTQPDTLSEATRNATRNGMLQRLFWLFGSAYPESENVRERLDLQRDYADIVRRLYGLRGAHGHVVQFSPEAHDTRREFAGYVDRLIALVEHDEPRMADHLGKAKGYYARVCLVMHLIEQADGIERPVSQDTASRAARLFVEYLLPHISAFYETTAEGSRSDLVPAALRRVAQVASLILRKPLQGVTAGVLGAGLNFWSSASLDEQGAILSTLVSHGWLRTDGNYSDQGTFLGEEGISRGRPTLWRYTVNPAVHDGRFSARRDVLQAAADARVTARGLPTMRAAD